jgi:transmembrane protein EpsG
MMDIKIPLFSLVILLGFLLGTGKDVDGKKRKWYVILMIVLFILESSLRSISVGPDTENYYYAFLSINDMSWGDVFNSFNASYQLGEGKDPGFAVFVKLVQLISTDFNFFLFIAALVFYIPLGKILYRYSSHILQLVFAFTLYVALFQIIALSGIRQQLATGFTFMSFLSLGKGKKIQSVLVILLASVLHISALLFLLVPAFSFISRRYLKTIHLLSFVTIPFVALYSDAIMSFMASFLANDYYSAYGQIESKGGGALYIILMELLSFFCFLAIKKDKVMNDRTTALLYIMLPLLTMTVPLISLDGTMIRIGQYFTLYMMVLVPMTLDSLGFKGNRLLLYYVSIAALILLSFNSGSFKYSFFWQ